ncbi:zinc metallopeptidase [bacterium]|nr:zinc metallopeptidase [bacterium]
MFMPMFDPTFILLIPALIFTFWAQGKVRGAYKKYSKVSNNAGLNGAQTARRILDRYGMSDVQIEMVAGELSDHYDPRTKVVRLSEKIHSGNSIASVAVAAHEVGHAIQHNEGYSALKLRHAMVGPVNFGSTMAMPLFFIGLIFTSPAMMDIGIVLFSLAVAFHLVTLPVEFNASNRAIKILSTDGYIYPEESKQARKMLNAAAWTYVAAATMALITLLRFILLRGMMGGDD